jgi:hypothetical protein
MVTAFNSYPLNHVLIKSLNTGVTGQSDSLGHFYIKCTDKDILLFSASGFNAKKVKIKKSQDISVELTYSNMESSFEDAVKNNHISEENLQKAIKAGSSSATKDYSKYKNIFDVINSEVFAVKVVGTSVITKRVQSFSLSPKVMFVVDEMVVADISTILPSEIKSIEFFDGVRASIYGSNGANGVLKITLKRSQ